MVEGGTKKNTKISFPISRKMKKSHVGDRIKERRGTFWSSKFSITLSGRNVPNRDFELQR